MSCSPRVSDATSCVLIIDTGVLLAAADSSDQVHRECAELVGYQAGQLVTTALVIAEAAYLLDREIGPEAEAALYTSIIDGDLIVENLDAHDWVRIRELVTRSTSIFTWAAPTRHSSRSRNGSVSPRSTRSTVDTSIPCVRPTLPGSFSYPEPRCCQHRSV